MNDYKLEINRSDLLGMLSKYYSEKLNKKIAVKESHKIDCVGLYEDEAVTVRIFFTEEISLLGRIATKTTEVTREDIRNILNEALEDDNYRVKEIFFDSGTTTTGSYMGEYEEAYFNGIEVTVEEKSLSRVLK